MKKITTLFGGVVLSALATQVSGQTILSEDFTNGFPSTFSVIDNDGNTPHSSVASVCQGAWNNVTFNTGNKSAVSTSYYSPAGTADDWMISSQISIPSTGATPYLVWKGRAYSASYPDGYEVKISTSTNSMSDFTTTIFSTTGENTAWTARYYDLSSYAGQNIYVAWRNNSNDMWFLFIDDILVAQLGTSDAGMASLDLVPVVATGTSVSIKGMMDNLQMPLTSVDINYSVNGGTVQTMSASNLSVAPGGSYSFTHNAAFTPSVDGAYVVKAWTSNPNGGSDANNANDTITSTFFATSNPSPRTVYIEEATGTWCGWCPRGAVGMDYMANTYHNDLIAIAVHNGDPMTVTAWDNGVGNYISGYPSSLVDRALFPDPNATALEGAYTTRKAAPPVLSTEVTNVTYNATSRTVTADVSATYDIAATGLDHRFVVVVWEDNVTGTTSGYNQANYYSGGGNGAMGGYENLPNPVPAASMEYDHVGRAIAPSFEGTQGSIPSTVTTGGTYTASITATLPASANSWNCHVGVIVVDGNSGEVMNGGKWNQPVSVSENAFNAEVSAYPQPAKDLLNVDMTLVESGNVTISLMNQVGQVVDVLDLGNVNGAQKVQLNTANYPAGMYILQVQLNDAVHNQKVQIIK